MSTRPKRHTLVCPECAKTIPNPLWTSKAAYMKEYRARVKASLPPKPLPEPRAEDANEMPQNCKMCDKPASKHFKGEVYCRFHYGRISKGED